MMEKIEWYQEVLELEPSSKVFFPLAKLLQNNNQPNEAVATLRQGLDRHPEFFEARLMLIDLLESSGRSEEALQEVERLGSKLDLYPGFWQAWAGVCEQQGQMDVSVALRLLAVSLSGKDVSLMDVLQQGLQSILGNPPVSGIPLTASSSVSDSAAPAGHLEPAPEVLEKNARSHAPVANATVSPAERGQMEESISLAPTEPDELADEEEPFSLRTRTMATVLLEQGDLQGALDIYEELLAVAESPEKKQELQERISELSSRMKTGVYEPEHDEPKADEPLQGKQKLLDALENLAKRLEVRAGG